MFLFFVKIKRMQTEMKYFLFFNVQQMHILLSYIVFISYELNILDYNRLISHSR